MLLKKSMMNRFLMLKPPQLSESSFQMNMLMLLSRKASKKLYNI